MLTPADATFAARDPALPDLACLLDSERLLHLLKPELSLDWSRLRIQPSSIRYKRGTSCLVGFHGHYQAHPISFYARLHTADQQRKAAKPLASKLAASPLGPGGLLLPERNLLLMMFPNDHELRCLRELFQEDSRSSRIEPLLPAGLRPPLSSLETLNYKPERRYVGRFRDADNHPLVIKAYARRHNPQAQIGPEQFQSPDGLRLRPRIGVDANQRLALFPWIEGTALCGQLQDSALLSTLGSRLAELHVLNHDSRSKDGAMDDLSPTNSMQASLQQAVAAIAEIAPSQRNLAQMLSTKLLESWASQPASQTGIRSLIHGDFSADQVIVEERHLCLIDFDRACWSHPVHDLGSFLAKLDLEQLHSSAQQSWHDISSQALVGGYLRTSPWPIAPLIQPSRGLHLFKLATEAFRLRQQDWPQRLEQVLHRISVVLNQPAP